MSPMPHLPTLVLEAPTDLVVRGDRVLDLVRRRWVRLTPEEWVRQHVLGFLRDRLGVPPALVSVERTVPGGRKRYDVMVVDRSGQAWMVVEVKAAHVALDQSVADQVGRYDAGLGARYVLVTNGRDLRGWERSRNGNFQKLSELPYFPKT